VYANVEWSAGLGLKVTEHWQQTLPMTLIMSVASPSKIHHYYKTPRSSTMLVRHLWHKLAILPVSNAPAKPYISESWHRKHLSKMP